MDLFRSKKRDVDQASLEVGAGLQKKHHGLSGSLGDLLDIGKDEEDCLGTASENTASESEDDENDINKASKKQKAFAKVSIKREKRKEKEQRKKTEKNLISMDDFLGKQAEFKMWLFEEKSKNAGEMASPKLKAHFKQFVRLWNKKKLASKYYRCSTLPESPAPLTPKKFNFLSEEVNEGGSPLSVDQDNDAAEKDVPTSPFVTFGKTPPKVFRSKKFQLFGSSKEVALLSVAPIGSPQVVKTEKENISKEQYQVPKFAKKKVTSDDVQKMPRGATPYKVSAFPWASKEIDVDQTYEVDICSTATPPSISHQEDQEEELWPPPPSDTELLGNHSARTNDSPNVPPPPPPRLESLQKTDCVSKSPKLAGNYADPYDRLPERQSNNKRMVCSDYQDPVDCVPVVKQRTIPEDARLVLKTLSGNDEPDLSLYSKPVSEKRLSKEELEELYAKPLKRAKRNDIGGLTDNEEKSNKKPEEQSELYNEIMKHIKHRDSADDASKLARFKPDPDYATIDECLGKVDSAAFGEKKNFETEEDEEKKANDLAQKSEDNSVQKFATISRSKKMRVMAASTEKIYETYLSLGRKANPFKSKLDIPKPPEPSAGFNSGMFTQSLKAKSKSQPDISFSEGLQTFEVDMNKEQDHTGSIPLLSFFKPVDNDRSANKNINDVRLRDSDRAKSYEHGLKDIEEPKTPIIMATPSFDSLCNVTPLSCKSFSSQSLPNKSGSYESLSSHSHMSTSTSSSLSFGPDEKSGSLQSLQSVKSLSPVKEEEELDQCLKTTEKELNVINDQNDIPKSENIGANIKDQMKPVGKDIVSTNYEASAKKDIIPLTPGKISALKHGIDLSVYLLNPAKQEAKEKDIDKEDLKDSQQTVDSGTGKLKRTGEPHCNQKLFDTQARLAIKDRLSGVRTKVDQGKPAARREMDGRHTVQTVQEISEDKLYPNTKGRKGETVSLGKSKFSQEGSRVAEGSHEPDSKRHCGDKKRVMSVDDHYLETDLDKVITDKGRRPMKKSKSHSGFETGSSAVVTEIW